MRFLVIAHRKPEFLPDDYAPHRAAEIGRALQLMREDRIREVYSFAKGGGAVLLMEASDEDHAREILDRLPLVHLNMVRIEIYGLAAYGGFFWGVRPG